MTENDPKQNFAEGATDVSFGRQADR